VPLLLQGLLVFLASTVAFDVVHYLLHAAANSSSSLLRRVGALHAVHHAFLDRELVIHRELLGANIAHHVIPEFLTQASFSLLLLALLPPQPVLVALSVQSVVFVSILSTRGMDINHRSIARLRAYRPTCFCVPRYHALHHVHPDAHFSSWIKLFDHLAGTGVSLAGRRVAITGGGAGFGAALCERLRERGVASITVLEPERDFDVADASRLAPVLRDVDILVLAHGFGRGAAPHGGCGSYVAAIEAFARVAAKRRTPIEVWGLGSEWEWWGGSNRADPGAARAGRAFARHARRYYVDDRVIYRHLVAGKLCSGAGKGRLTARRAAAMACFFIERGYNFVPVTLTGVALLYFPRFLLLRPAPADAS